MKAGEKEEESGKRKEGGRRRKGGRKGGRKIRRKKG